jgi:class 3 adenylate cyclase
MDVPDVRYARAGGVAIAYQVVGAGQVDLVYAPHLCDLLTPWLAPWSRPFLDRLTSEVRLIMFNPRGTGLSDRPRNVTLEARMDDITLLLDDLELPRASILGASTSANACALFAATFPERCERLVLYRPFPRAVRSDQYPFGIDEHEWLSWLRDIREGWGDRTFTEEFGRDLEAALVATEDGLDWFTWQNRLALSPGAAADWVRMAMETDIADVLSSIRAPTLVVHTASERDVARYTAGLIRDVRTAEVDGLYEQATLDAILEFLAGEVPAVVPDSVLATVLFTDLVSSTETAVELGDRAWKDVLAAHQRLVRQELGRFRGTEVDTAGDGFFCRFDGPARAIACARRIVEGARSLGLDVRAGVHTGECELVGEKIAGIAVVTGSRISSLAAPGEVLVSSTVKDLVAGSGFAFDERGEHELKGVPGTWRLYAVAGG